MKVKLFVLSLTLIFSFTVVCTADTPEFESPVFGDDGLVTINCNIGKAGEDITLRVYKDNENPSADDFVAVLQEKSGGDGAASFVFKIPHTKNGVSTNGRYIVEYNVFEGEKERVTDFEYVNFEYLKDSLRQADTVEKIKDIFDSANSENRAALKMMSFDMSGYDLLNDEEQTTATETFLALADLETDSIEKLCADYSKAVGIGLINKGKTQMGLKYINPEYESGTYNSSSDKFKERIGAAVISMTPVSVSDFDEKYKECCDVYKLVNENSYGIGECIKNQKELFGFNNSKKWQTYSNMSSIKKGYAHDKMAELFDSQVYSYSDSVKVFENAVSYVNETLTGSSGSSSGKSSGGGSSTPQITSAATALPQNVIKSYSDISGYEWAEEAIVKLSEKNILTGYGDNTFLPGKSMTREEFVKLLVLSVDVYDSSCECDFSDVKKDSWFYPYVAGALKNGLINGISTELFGTGQFVTRQDMAVMICRAADKKGILLGGTAADNAFTDENMIADYAKESTLKLYNAGIIAGMGDGRFVPGDSLTRAQAAKVIYECFFKS